MPDIPGSKVSELAAVSTIEPGDEFYLSRGGEDFRLPGDVLLDRIDDNAVGVYNVLAHGVLGDGSMETVAIQAVINLCDFNGGGIVYFPWTSASYLFTFITVPDRVALGGDGWVCNANVPMGDAQWDDTTLVYGSVLRFTTTTGYGIQFLGKNAPYRMRDLLVAGPGSGSSTGTVLGDPDDPDGPTASVRDLIHNVMIVNCSRPWNLQGAENSDFLIGARGCEYGITTANAFNDNRVRFEVQFYSVKGLEVADATKAEFDGLLQNGSGTASVHHVSGDLTRYRCYHESEPEVVGTPPTDLIIQDAGSDVVFDSWKISSTGGRVSLNGGTAQLTRMRAGTLDIVLGAGLSGVTLGWLTNATISGDGLAVAEFLEGGVAYTPTISGTGWALGNGTAVGWVTRRNGYVTYDIQIVWGSTSTFGTGRLDVGLHAAFPFGNPGLAALRGVLNDASDNFYNVNVQRAGDVARLFQQGTDGAAWGGNVTGTSPFAVAAGDAVYVSGTAKAA